MKLKTLKKVSFSFTAIVSFCCYMYLNFHGVHDQLFIHDIASTNLSADITEFSDGHVLKRILIKVFEFITL